jgi:hypothetical protein
MSGFSGGGSADFSQIVVELQASTQLLAAIQQVLVGGVAILATWPVYLVADLPATAAVPTFAYASDGRKPGEGGGSGTGVPVFFDISGVWFSFCDGAAVAA